MLRRRVSEASIFEVVKNKFTTENWEKSPEQRTPTWELTIDTSRTDTTTKDLKGKEDGEFHISQYADHTLCAFEIYNSKLKRNIRPSEQQLDNLLTYLQHIA
ncbi:MAG: hypothetical protein ACI85I_002119 [Arenicella sp.]|jgi:hypothetical protein